MPRAMQRQTALLLGRLGRDNRIFALVTASQIASASVASFFCRLTYGFTYAGGISRTVWPSVLVPRPVVRRGTGLDAHQARGQLLEECENIAPL